MRWFLLLACTVPLLAGPADLPSAERWVAHLKHDLLPLWTTTADLGNEPGSFPSTRCDDGTLFDRTLPCAEVARNRSIDPDSQ